jgi:hypothetical protein
LPRGSEGFSEELGETGVGSDVVTVSAVLELPERIFRFSDVLRHSFIASHSSFKLGKE